MTPRMSTFQGVILGLFGFAIVIGVFFFATSANFNNAEDIGAVEIWGTIDRTLFEDAVAERRQTDRVLLNVSYVEKSPATFDVELSEALAAGEGPDLILLEQDSILRHEAKLLVFPYDSFMKEQRYRDTFLDEAELYLVEEGTLGIPAIVDPLVLYWNREMLAASGFSQAPKYWDEVFTIAEEVSKKDERGTITKSAIAFGEFANVLHAKDIVSTLVMQAGGSIVLADSTGKLSQAISRQASGDGERPGISALRFYTGFANPSENIYSWNRSEPNSLEAFARSELALYVGYASELSLIAAQNPNLQFAVAPLPQIRDGRIVSFGHLYAYAIPRASDNIEGAAIIAELLSASEFSEALSEATQLPPVRRDLLSRQYDGPMLIFRDMALVARGWLDPNREETDAIFKRMIEGVSSGSARLTDAVDRAGQSLNSLLR